MTGFTPMRRDQNASTHAFKQHRLSELQAVDVFFVDGFCFCCCLFVCFCLFLSFFLLFLSTNYRIYDIHPESASGERKKKMTKKVKITSFYTAGNCPKPRVAFGFNFGPFVIT